MTHPCRHLVVNAVSVPLRKIIVFMENKKAAVQLLLIIHVCRADFARFLRIEAAL
jgi:hypothetical protein